MPAFTEGDEREDQRIAGFVASGLEALSAEDVGEGVDAARPMEEHDGRDDAPDKELRAISIVASGAEPGAGSVDDGAGE